MDYSIWIDADGRPHNISEIESSYISACLTQLDIAIETYLPTDGSLPVRSNRPSSDDVLHQNWTIDHALNYRSSFQAELKRRNQLPPL